jgi:hypothetical protein
MTIGANTALEVTYRSRQWFTDTAMGGLDSEIPPSSLPVLHRWRGRVCPSMTCPKCAHIKTERRLRYVSADFRTGLGRPYEGYAVRMTHQDTREALSGVSDPRSETPLCELKRDARVMTKSGC